MKTDEKIDEKIEVIYFISTNVIEFDVNKDKGVTMKTPFQNISKTEKEYQ